MNKLYYLFAALLLTVSCGQSSDITGEWVQPVPGMENQVQGFKLDKDGKALSINMHTLLINSWQREGDKLTLNGESLGNGRTIVFHDSYKIIKLTGQELVLKSDDREDRYQRREMQE